MTSTTVDHVPSNKGRKLPPEPLSADEVKALIRACSTRATTGIRNRALIVVLYRAGLRISEALALLPKTWTQPTARSGSCTARATMPAWLAWTLALGNPTALARPPGRRRHQRPCPRVLHAQGPAGQDGLRPRTVAAAGTQGRHRQAGSCPRPTPHPRLRTGRRRHPAPRHSGPAWPRQRCHDRSVHPPPEPLRGGRDDEGPRLDAVEAQEGPWRPAGCP